MLTEVVLILTFKITKKNFSVRRYRRSGNFYNPDFFANEADKNEILKV